MRTLTPSVHSVFEKQEFFKISEVARLFGITVQSVHEWVTEGKLHDFLRTSKRGNYLVPRRVVIGLLKRAEHEVPGLWTRQRKKLLVVDDDAPIRMLVKAAFRKSKLRFRVMAASSVEDGIVLAAKSEPDVILLDSTFSRDMLQCEMALAFIRNAKLMRGIKVIGMGYHPAIRGRMMDAGANDFLMKPFGLGELRQIVCKYALRSR